MEIDVSKIPENMAPDKIKEFIQEEISAGKLTNWKIANIEMRQPTKDKEFPGHLFLIDSPEFPKLFTILEKDLGSGKYVLKISIQINKIAS